MSLLTNVAHQLEEIVELVANEADITKLPPALKILNRYIDVTNDSNSVSGAIRAARRLNALRDGMICNQDDNTVITAINEAKQDFGQFITLMTEKWLESLTIEIK